jgi:hypothetical protein
MIKKEFRDVRIEVSHDVICDICGNSCSYGEFGFEYMNLDANWGYNSKLDGEKWSAQICENCVIEHLKPLIKFNIEE